ncbi:hypothetical protein KEM55_005841 [Ascosphaera atra]|nr:hypothetical protein KEM55_005841 [Ascosphaera atra]
MFGKLINAEIKATSATIRIGHLKTPPIGAPKATEIPEAAAAERISRLRASFRYRLLKGFMKRFAQQQATCINGPSLPSHKPEATARHKPKDLMSNVHGDKNSCMTKPFRRALISGIPLCLAYGAKTSAKQLAAQAKSIE